MRDNLQDQFKKLLHDAEVRPPAGLWNRIERELPQAPGSARIIPLVLGFLTLLVSSLGLFLLIDYDQGALQPLVAAKHYPPGDRQRNILTSPVATNKTLLKPALKNPATTIVLTNNSPAQVASGLTSVKALSATRSAIFPVQQTQVAAPKTEPVFNAADLSAKPDLSVFATVVIVPVQNGHSANSVVTAFDNSSSHYCIRIRSGEAVPLPTEPLPASALIASLEALPAPAFGQKGRQYDPEEAARRQQKLEQFRTYDAVRGFHLGTFIGINSTWMSRKEDLLEHEENFIDSKTHVGLNFGMIAGYDIREKWGIQFEPAIRNSKGQRFTETCHISGEKTEKKLTLRYYRFPLLLKYKIGLIGGPERRPMVVGFVAGPMFNILNEKTLYEGTKAVYVSPEIVNHEEFGVMTGFDLDLYLNKNMYFTTGTRFTLSASFDQQKPLTVQLGFNAQFHFRLPPRESKPAKEKR